MKAYFARYLLSALLIFLPLVGGAANYRGAELRTFDAYLYGRFEVKFKPPSGDGLVASFFTYNDLNPITPWNEIDLEILGRYENVLDFVTITKGQDIHKSNRLTGFDPHLGFNIYAFEWTPDYVAWFVNGEEAYRQAQNHIALLTEPQKIMMNIWLPVYWDWVGDLDDRILPRFSYYDHVSYATYTPDSGNVGTDNDFTLEWRDDFDFYDSTRWEKKDSHTWPGNRATIINENIVFKDGYMILCLTDDGNIGFVDNNPPAALWARADTNKITIRFSEELDSTSAVKTNNYVISGLDVLSSQLLVDKRTVELSVSELDFENPGNLVLMGIQDDAEPPNTLLGQVVNIIVPEVLSFPVKINVGGDEFHDFLADQWWTAETEYGHEDGSLRWIDEGISNTELDTLYASAVSRLVGYRVRLSDGIYKVKMMFCENYYDEPGERVFDVYIEGNKAVEELDLYSQVGKHYAHDVLLEEITVDDGELNINFSAVEFGDGTYEDRGALLSGLIIERTGNLKTEHGSISVPQRYVLHQNYPNPFNPATSIAFSVPKTTDVTLKIFNLLGEHIATLVEERLTAGNYSYPWFADNLPSGIYFCALKSGSHTQTKKMILLR